MSKSILERLQELAEKERKRRDRAVKYLEKLIDILVPIFDDLFGVEFNPYLWKEDYFVRVMQWSKEQGEYVGSQMYFRYKTHYFDNGNYENVGFYVTLDDQFTPIGGTNLLSLKGYEFWFRVKQICDWLTNYIPEQIEKADKSRDSRLDHLDKVVNALNEI